MRPIYDSRQWLADCDRVAASLPELDELAGSTVLVTGAGGLICSAAVDVLVRYNETHGTPIRICAAGRSEERMRQRFGAYMDRAYFAFVPFDAARYDGGIPVSADYIVHGAGGAYPALFVRRPAETMTESLAGTRRLLSCARERGTRRFLYVSSSEVYGRKQTDAPFREDEYGYIDLLDPRSCYSMGKRAAETLCASYAAEYGVGSVIVRPGHIYGPTASERDNRVSSMFAYAAARGEDIVMKSDGAQLRSYCYCLDCAGAIWTALLRGGTGRAYNISNPDSIITICQMAEKLAAAGGVRLRVQAPSEEEKKGFNPMSNSSLDSARLAELGWRGLFDADTGLGHTVEILRGMLRA